MLFSCLEAKESANVNAEIHLAPSYSTVHHIYVFDCAADTNLKH
jgi:hypothetical protein